MITEYTKLINCTGTVEVFDYKSCSNLNKEAWISNKEKLDDARHAITVKRLATTNFSEKGIVIYLRYEGKEGSLDICKVKKEITNLIDRLKRRLQSLQSLCIIELPKTAGDMNVDLHLLLNQSLYDLIYQLPATMEIDHFFEQLWGHGFAFIEEAFPIPATFSELSSILNENTESPHYNGKQLYMKSGNLKKPVTLFGEKANSFIKNHRLMDEDISLNEEYYEKNWRAVHHIEYLTNHF